MWNKKMSEFAKYKLGYIDGYDGNIKQLPNDNMYILGYEAGRDDDYLGDPSKFIDTNMV